MGGVRRVARESFGLTYVSGVSNQTPAAVENWTTQETTTYVPATPANAPGVWGGTKADLDRVLTATGSGYTVLGMLVTWVNKPNFTAGAIIKVAVTYAAGSTCAIEVWSKSGATWTKQRRVSIAGIARSGDTLVLDLTSPILAPANCDAYWITLAPDIGTETLTWYACHLYGICNNDPVTPPCPPGTPPEDCDSGECDADEETWECKDIPDDPITPTVTLPPIVVKIPNPTYTKSGASYFHNCPRPTAIRMYFGELPTGGSVTVTVAPYNQAQFSAVQGVGPVITSQTISAPGTMDWFVYSGFKAANGGVTVASLPPAGIQETTDFIFTRQLDGPAVIAAANLLDILTFFWTWAISYQEVC